MDLALIARRPPGVLLPLTFGFAFFGLSLTPSFIPSLLLLSSLLFYIRRDESFVRSGLVFRVITAWITLTVSVTLSHLQASIHALSSTSTSVISLALLSAVSSMIGLLPIVLHRQVISSTTGARSVRLFAFPTIWTVVWLITSRISPLGRLITWTPLQGISSYEWLLPYFGFSGIDFVTASWANVIVEGIEGIIQNRRQPDESVVDLLGTSKPPPRKSNLALPTSACLLLLAIPSFLINSFPYPVVSSDTIALKVACILPEASSGLQFDRFMEETVQYESKAKILLWPEGAVRFESEEHKMSKLQDVQKSTHTQKTFVGVSFEERLPESEGRRDGQHRNGLALVGPDKTEFSYYKRNLVPFTESFSQVTTGEAPEIHNIEYPLSNKKGDTRSIPITASICLDFSMPLTSLSSRPALVLAPAKTWHRSVGEAMYHIARLRGREIGAEVLWCDGGAGGVSGVGENVQVGQGSWVKTIGVPYPFQNKRTPYGFGGDSMVLAILALISGTVWVVHQKNLSFDSSPRIVLERVRLSAITDGIANVRNRIGDRLRRRNRPETTPLLVDVSDT